MEPQIRNRPIGDSHMLKRYFAVLILLSSLLPSVGFAQTRTSVATDNFNRASLGANWQQVNSSLGGNLSINGSVTFESTHTTPGGSSAAAVWVGAGSFTADQYSSAVFVDTSFGGENYGIGVLCRASTDTDAARDYYQFEALSNNTGRFGKVVNGTYTEFNAASVTWANGDRVEIECQGTTIRAMRNGTALGGAWTVTDSDLSTGAPGIAATGASGVAEGDDWIGGNLSASARAVRHQVNNW
jgi:hypothetical protein